MVYTGGMDGTMRIWDIGKRAVIKVFGSEEQTDYSFHTQTIWSILPDVDDPSIIWTGGRDGKIFITDIEEGKARCLLDGTKSITCIANDQTNSKLWFGTEESSIQCIEKQAVCEIEDEEVFTKPTYEVPGKPF